MINHSSLQSSLVLSFTVEIWLLTIDMQVFYQNLSVTCFGKWIYQQIRKYNVTNYKKNQIQCDQMIKRYSPPHLGISLWLQIPCLHFILLLDPISKKPLSHTTWGWKRIWDMTGVFGWWREDLTSPKRKFSFFSPSKTNWPFEISGAGHLSRIEDIVVPDQPISWSSSSPAHTWLTVRLTSRVNLRNQPHSPQWFMFMSDWPERPVRTN